MTGSALYIFFILANNVTYATTFTDIEFVLDNGAVASTYTHTPGTATDYQYNVPVYANDSLGSGQHNMMIQPVNSGNNVLILFDYLIYTCVLCLVLRQAILMCVPLARIHRVPSHHLPQQRLPHHLPQQPRPDLKGHPQDKKLALLLVAQWVGVLPSYS